MTHKSTQTKKDMATLQRVQREVVRFFPNIHQLKAGGVRHGPQRVMGKNITDVHYTRDTME